jgi:cytosolic carboxypeptidase protein 2/3
MGNLDKYSKQINRNSAPKPYYAPFPGDNTLVFESRFESGNLELALKVSDYEYNLVLTHDVNTAGNTQWFFYRVGNTTEGMKVKFNIINLGKGDSLFNMGMKVLVYSEIDEKQHHRGWVRDGEEFLYYKNSMYKPSTSKNFYSMSFSYTFHHTKDTVFFAYCYPYTYTQLMQTLLSLENTSKLGHLFSRKLLCYTIEGNRCDYLTITSSDLPEYMKNRKGVVFSARAHPGESVGSWMMHGLIEFLLGDSKEAALIRDNYVIKLIPMLNPDGVINGMYRCNLSGSDLNRKWKAPSKMVHPTVYYAKRLIRNFAKERKLELICDLHGHSRRMNMFMYGCSVPGNPEISRQFPLILSKLSPTFSYKSCSFHMQPSKDSTLRISMFKELEIPSVYTLEASFCGGNGMHFSVEDLKNMGKSLCLGLLVQINSAEVPESIGFSSSDVLSELKNNKELLIDDSDTSGSESEPSEDNVDDEVLKPLLPKPAKPKKKKAKEEHKSPLAARKRASLPNRTDRRYLFADKEKDTKKAERKKCPDCGDIEIEGHICVKKLSKNYSPSPTLYKRGDRPLPSSVSSLSIYVSPKGKKVRDQATQTLYVKRSKNDPANSHSLSLIIALEKTPSPGKYRLENYMDTNRLKDMMLIKPSQYVLK